MSISIQHLQHIYDPGTNRETMALQDINLEIESGELIGLIGHTGSGKSTLIQEMNGLLIPTSGEIIVSGYNITNYNIENKKKLNKKERKQRQERLLNVRRRVGLVFQYPEYQLFEETVGKDIAFGPKNLGLTSDVVAQRVRESMSIVGLDYDVFAEKSPFDLSGGQKRRVAIAGVLAMSPEVLILDEPTAGLDPKGRDEILEQIKVLHQQKNITVIIVSHSMEDMAKVAQRLVVMSQGKILLNDTPARVFSNVVLLEEIGLAVPQVTYLLHQLREAGLPVALDILDVKEAAKEIYRAIKGGENA